MKVWADFFEQTDGMPEPEREKFYKLLHRNFVAAGSPRTWEGYRAAPQELQQRLTTEYGEWVNAQPLNFNARLN